MLLNMRQQEKTQYTSDQVFTVAYQLVFQTGLFLDDCKICHCKDPTNKSWNAFKIFFLTSHQEWRNS